MKTRVLFALLILLSACAKPAAVDVTEEKRNGMDNLRNYLASADVPSTPFHVRMSLRFGSAEDTRRVTALFWGNGEDRLRLDVMAGIGVTAAKIAEDDRHFLVYSPNENKAWFFQGTAKPLLRIGVPIPFHLSHLANLLNGRYARVFGKECGQGELSQDGLLRCELAGKPGGSLTIDADGLPRLWHENRKDGGWEMRIVYSEDARGLPHRLMLTAEDGKRAVVLVKEREKPSTPFTDGQLRLALPEDTPLLPLAKYKSVLRGQ
ncbi:MAG: hypothetical protein LBN96_09060 [Desulfovibrio sp.]|jgi:outer membrane biogenesis lipoprotein LolB|nr:hypothetical protein [Desulfovibrio sp.]